ncbi:hypothetical protein GGU11DRAFT_13710 [Lentinula aff. detonsa]|nr:hypothetical protein GGU11DRAFT_13710 [Lentinula aff. detonsa]
MPVIVLVILILTVPVNGQCLFEALSPLPLNPSQSELSQNQSHRCHDMFLSKSNHSSPPFPQYSLIFLLLRKLRNHGRPFFLSPRQPLSYRVFRPSSFMVRR